MSEVERLIYPYKHQRRIVRYHVNFLLADQAA